jgi:hypothetical protein
MRCYINAKLGSQVADIVDDPDAGHAAMAAHALTF